MRYRIYWRWIGERARTFDLDAATAGEARARFLDSVWFDGRVSAVEIRRVRRVGS